MVVDGLRKLQKGRNLWRVRVDILKRACTACMVCFGSGLVFGMGYIQLVKQNWGNHSKSLIQKRYELDPGLRNCQG